MSTQYRFVDREKWDEPKDEGLMTRERVLQFRETAVFMTDFGKSERWGNWYDVPTVKMKRKHGDGFWTVINEE